MKPGKPSKQVQIIRAAQLLAAQGGSANTAAQRRARIDNLKKARALRWKKTAQKAA